MRRLLLCLFLVAASSPGCSKSKKGESGSEAEEAKSSSVDDVLAAWRGAGLAPGTFGEVKSGPLGGDCQAGTVEGLETILCEYPDEKAAEKATDVGFQVVGETTGTAMAAGRMLLVVADRSQADPEGKRLNKLAKVFRDREKKSHRQ